MKTFSVIAVLLSVVVMSPRAVFSESAGKKYELRERSSDGPSQDATKKRILKVEDNRELTSEGNIVRVEGTDDYLGKGIEELRKTVAALNERTAGLEDRVTELESRLTRARPVPRAE